MINEEIVINILYFVFFSMFAIVGIITVIFFSLSGKIDKEYMFKIYTFQKMKSKRNNYKILLIRLCYAYGVIIAIGIFSIKIIAKFK